ncbi:hypothetical protein TUMSATVNIG1_46900 [Vibrio nigripulchritudo]|nr:hypothetical protein VNTUMSATTG_46580 [Vibrio nigripulchritudo]BDU34081.1 hypothetical protein TUMSATVNIG1_46900 [Vibrio nigripulchritudo]BDU40135.1 hypothetical protein TUMSATVNIG2_46040 [Vibrio nigripulchritudo]BDU45869.1 hypothetical protein TUMSATVNIG3_46670 [Vibrio nigripulchritudo]
MNEQFKGVILDHVSGKNVIECAKKKRDIKRVNYKLRSYDPFSSPYTRLRLPLSVLSSGA